MSRTSIIEQLTTLTGESAGLYSAYSDSELKKILDDITTVTVKVDYTNLIILGVVIIGAVLLILKK